MQYSQSLPFHWQNGAAELPIYQASSFVPEASGVLDGLLQFSKSQEEAGYRRNELHVVLCVLPHVKLQTV